MNRRKQETVHRAFHELGNVGTGASEDEMVGQPSRTNHLFDFRLERPFAYQQKHCIGRKPAKMLGNVHDKPMILLISEPTNMADNECSRWYSQLRPHLARFNLHIEGLQVYAQRFTTPARI